MSEPEKIEFHPIANIFPLIEGAEFNELVTSISENGLREPIVLYEGKILDGRNRWLACLKAGRRPRFEFFEGDDPVAFVIDANLRRRHLNESQRAMVAAKLATLRDGQRKSASPIGEASFSQREAADLLNVGKRSVERAREVHEGGAPELIHAVERGRIAVSAAADVATLEPGQQRELVARGEKEILQAAKIIRAERSEARRTERVRNLVEISKGNAQLGTDQKFPIIYADPPWRYEHPPMGGNRVIENHYPTMTLAEICALPVLDLATDDAVLFMWATAPKLAECFEVLNAWGFEYRTCAVWVKDKIGMGFYVRNQHELLLIAKRGDPPMPAEGDRSPSVIMAARTEHSEKPVEFYELIERMYPELPKIELFARDEREGWQRWGNQANPK
jgi:N6-adenosine-specific RNA methylase IME4